MRKFPHNACLFNLTQDELRELVIPWCQEKWIEVGERKWNPYEARMTVLEGPHLELEDLALGRGWRNAQHHSQDVTERVMAQVRAHLEDASASAAAPVGPATAGLATPGDTTGSAAAKDEARLATPGNRADVHSLHGLLGSDPTALLQAWRLTTRRRPELSPSQSLALAESTLSALDADSA